LLEGLQIDLEKSSLSEQVFRHIRRLILAEELKGGQRIPEEAIANAFGVSRTPIREALRKLEKHGLVKIVPRSHAEVIKLDPEDAKQLSEVRIQLESLTTRRLAKSAGEEDIKVLRELSMECARFVKEGDIANAFEKDSQLHLEIARRSGNRHAFDLLRNLNEKINLLRITHCVSLDKIAKDIEVHPAIIEAMARHDASKAEKLMIQHIRNVDLR
jgi:DNA-binding GntR family transcriptional regulator